jgi:ribonuclease G
MSKELFVTSTPHETKLAIMEDDRLVEIYFERENEYTLAGSIYKGKVTRVLPGMQSAFVDIGLDRDAFLYVTDFLEEVEGDDDLETVSSKPPDKADKGRRERGPQRPRQEAHPAPQAPLEIDTDLTHGGELNAAEQTEAAISEDLTAEEREQTELPDRSGTRRWRGRRGRRRGRGSARGEAQSVSPSTDTTAEDVPEVPVTQEGNEKPEGTGVEIPVALEAEQQQSQMPPRESKKEAPSRPRYEPIVLPGESLRKFNRPERQEPTGTPRVEENPKPSVETRLSRPAPRPSTEVTDPAAFLAASHGVLAGESLAKYRNRPQPAPEPLAPSQDQVNIEEQHQHAVEQAGEVEEKLGRQTVETAFAPDLIEEEQAEAVEAPGKVEPPRPDEGRGSYNFAPGAGVIEEEEIAHSDEEQELSEYRESSEGDHEF